MGVWDFIQDQVLGMKWLNELLGIGLSALGLDVNGRIGGSVQVFLENHGSALRIDFCNLLYSKLFSARAK